MIEEDLRGCNSGAVRFVSGDVYRRRIRCSSEKSEKRDRNEKIKKCMRIWKIEGWKMENGVCITEKTMVIHGNY